MSDELGHAEVEEERPHQDRGAAEHRDVHIGQSCGDFAFRNLHQAERDAEHQCDREGKQRDQQRVPQARQQCRHRLFDQSEETDLLLFGAVVAIVGDHAGNRFGLLFRALLAKILCDDSLVFSRSDHLVQSIVDGGQQICVHAFVHGHAVFAVRHLRSHDFQTVVLRYAICQYRIIVEHRDGIAGFDHLVHG